MNLSLALFGFKPFETLSSYSTPSSVTLDVAIILVEGPKKKGSALFCGGCSSFPGTEVKEFTLL